MQQTLGNLDAMFDRLGIGPGCKKQLRHSNDFTGSSYDDVYALYTLSKLVSKSFGVRFRAQVNSVSLGASILFNVGEFLLNPSVMPIFLKHFHV